MSLSKYYDKQYSNYNILNKIPYFKKNQKNTADLNDLLREHKDDFEVEGGQIKEKNQISYTSSLHT